jgi:hypothetical protein
VQVDTAEDSQDIAESLQEPVANPEEVPRLCEEWRNLANLLHYWWWSSDLMIQGAFEIKIEGIMLLIIFGAVQPVCKSDRRH